MRKDMDFILYEAEEIAPKVAELGEKITLDYQGRDLIAVCILKGSLMFYADLLREIKLPLVVDFMAISSYGNSRKSSGVVQIVKDMDNNISDKDVLIVEDIMDSGQTLAFLMELLQARDPLSLRVCCLLDKPSRRIAPVQPDYCGFEIPDEFVVGYGLDFAERYRNLPYIGVLKPSVYE